MTTSLFFATQPAWVTRSLLYGLLCLNGGVVHRIMQQFEIQIIYILCRRITMKKLKDILPFLMVVLADFYLLPLFIQDTGTAMLMLLVVVPLICFICFLIYGLKKPFSLLYSAAVVILFIPSIFIFYNSSAWVYIIAYGVIALT